MKRRMTAFCITCDGEVEYTVFAERVETVVRGVKISYVEVTAKCPVCGDEIYVPEINDTNVQAREDAYRKEMHLITASEVREILDKYNIGAGPLANLLGVGEVTINRYLLGQLPSREISEKLYTIRADRRLMREYLENGKGKITQTAYDKCEEALNGLDEKYGTSRIELVTRYLLSRSFDVTPLALQKLLYYAQAFFHALFGRDLFVDDCQAWSYGPVYPDIYYRYRSYRSEPIPQEEINGLDELTAEEKSFLDDVIRIFGYFSGPTLSSITHAEKPWLKARGNLRPEDRCSNIIDRDVINAYFDSVVKNYDIIVPNDMEKYCKAMLNLRVAGS